MFDPDFGSALEAGEAIRARRISSVELIRHTFDRVKRYNPDLNAIILQFEDQAMASAAEADAAFARRDVTGPFHGVPVTIKECLAWRSTPSTAGVADWRDARPGIDAASVTRLEGLGAIVIGKTNVPVLLSDWQSFNPIYGTSNNPWDVKMTPGGSSGGSAAALAAGLGFVSIGSDIGGSIRVPAHFCGVCGHKPSLNLVPTQGHVPPPVAAMDIPPADLEVVGPMARHPRDLEASLRAMAGPCGMEAKAYSVKLPEARHGNLKDFRVGALVETPECRVDSETGRIVEELYGRLAPRVKKFTPGLPAGFDAGRSFRQYGFLLGATLSSAVGDAEAEGMRSAGSMGHFDTFRQAHFERHRYYMKANGARLRIRVDWEEYFREFDVFLMPAAFVPAFAHQHEGSMPTRKLSVEGVARDYFEMVYYPHFATVAGLPATVVPAGRTKAGLPVGIQIIGPYLEDLTALEFGALMEEVAGGFQAPPGYR